MSHAGGEQLGGGLLLVWGAQWKDSCNNSDARTRISKRLSHEEYTVQIDHLLSLSHVPAIQLTIRRVTALRTLPGGCPTSRPESRAQQGRLMAIGAPPWGLVGVCLLPVSLPARGVRGGGWAPRAWGRVSLPPRVPAPPYSKSTCTAEGAPGSSSVGFGR